MMNRYILKRAARMRCERESWMRKAHVWARKGRKRHQSMIKFCVESARYYHRQFMRELLGVSQ